MNISKINSNYTGAVVKPENVKQNSTDKQIEKQTNVSDSFTKSAVADLAFRNSVSKTSNEAKIAVRPGQQESSPINNSNSTTDNPDLAENYTEDQSMNLKMESATKATDSKKASVINNKKSKIVSSIKTFLSKYSAAQIAKYDSNRNGKIDFSEEAKIKAAKQNIFKA